MMKNHNRTILKQELLKIYTWCRTICKVSFISTMLNALCIIMPNSLIFSLKTHIYISHANIYIIIAVAPIMIVLAHLTHKFEEK